MRQPASGRQRNLPAGQVAKWPQGEALAPPTLLGRPRPHLEVRKGAHRRRRGLGLAVQPQRQLGDHSQGALAAHQQGCEVVARRALAHAAACGHGTARRRCRSGRGARAGDSRQAAATFAPRWAGSGQAGPARGSSIQPPVPAQAGGALLCGEWRGTRAEWGGTHAEWGGTHAECCAAGEQAARGGARLSA